MSLYIYAEDTNLRQALKDHIAKHRWTDSGFDVPMLSPVWTCLLPCRNFGLKLGIKVAAIGISGQCMPCLLLPRSSIGSTSFRLTNSIGLIDQGYRGEVQAKVDVLDLTNPWESGTRMFQLCRRDFMPWSDVILVDDESKLPTAPDNRGEGGFGSTG